VRVEIDWLQSEEEVYRFVERQLLVVLGLEQGQNSGRKSASHGCVSNFQSQSISCCGERWLMGNYRDGATSTDSNFSLGPWNVQRAPTTL